MQTAESGSKSQNNEYSFKDDPWGMVANKYYNHLRDYDDTKWEEIVLGSARYLNTKKGKTFGDTPIQQGSNEDDGDDNITRSP